MPNKLCIMNEEKNPEILVVTPLLPDHDVSRQTKISIKRNKTKYFWVKSYGNNNIPTNALNGINWYKDFKKLPPYYIMIDRDITLGRGMLDKLVDRLKKTDDSIGFAYASFEFQGYVNRKFPAVEYNINTLVQGNYISSNSMFKSSVIEDVGLVTDDKYKRLLDWAFLLKCYSHGYYGVPVSQASFVAQSTQNDVSAGSTEDYRIKHQRVHDDFIKPLLE